MAPLGPKYVHKSAIDCLSGKKGAVEVAEPPGLCPTAEFGFDISSLRNLRKKVQFGYILTSLFKIVFAIFIPLNFT